MHLKEMLGEFSEKRDLRAEVALLQVSGIGEGT